MPDLDGWLQRARAGDREALAELYRALAEPLLGFLITQVRRREDAEDLLGEVFIAAIRDLHRFSGDAGGFRAWLYRIATNRAIDFARRTARRPQVPLDEAAEHAAAADPALDALERVERARLWAAVLELPPDQRRVIALRLAGGLQGAEIAPIVGKTPGAVKALQHRALVNLARALGRAYPGEDPGRLEEGEA